MPPTMNQTGPSLSDLLANSHPQARSMARRLGRAHDNLVDHLHTLGLSEDHLMNYALQVVKTVADGEQVQLKPVQTYSICSTWLSHLGSNGRVSQRDHRMCENAAKRMADLAAAG